MREKSPKRKVCGCKAYRYPHRIGSGLCQVEPEPAPIKEGKSVLASNPVYPGKMQVNAALTVLGISQADLDEAIGNGDLDLAKQVVKRAFAKIVSVCHPDRNQGSREREVSLTDAVRAKGILDKITDVKDYDFRRFATVSNRRDEKIRKIMEMMDEFFLSKDVRQA